MKIKLNLKDLKQLQEEITKVLKKSEELTDLYESIYLHTSIDNIIAMFAEVRNVLVKKAEDLRIELRKELISLNEKDLKKRLNQLDTEPLKTIFGKVIYDKNHESVDNYVMQIIRDKKKIFKALNYEIEDNNTNTSNNNTNENKNV